MRMVLFTSPLQGKNFSSVVSRDQAGTTTGPEAATKDETSRLQSSRRSATRRTEERWTTPGLVQSWTVLNRRGSPACVSSCDDKATTSLLHLTVMREVE